jgi:hypothetical protein
MRTLAIILAFTAAAFAGSTVYLAHQLSVQRAANAELARLSTHRPAADSDAPVAAEGWFAGTAATAAPAEMPAHMEAFSEGNGVVSDTDLQKLQAEYGNRFLAELADPARRQELIDERKMMFRRAYPRVDRVLGLTPDEYSRFTEHLAEQQLHGQEADARCMLNPDCQTLVANEVQVGPDDPPREIRELLGPARLQKFEQYKSSMGERESMAQFRNRLPDDLRFSEDVNESLVSALADERQQIQQEARQQGRDVSGFASGAGMVFTGADGDSADERYHAARQNSQRFHDRAAQILNPQQLRAFDEMQEENLIGLRSLLRNKDILTSVDAAARTD